MKSEKNYTLPFFYEVPIVVRRPSPLAYSNIKSSSFFSWGTTYTLLELNPATAGLFYLYSYDPGCYITLTMIRYVDDALLLGYGPNELHPVTINHGGLVQYAKLSAVTCHLNWLYTFGVYAISVLNFAVAAFHA